ncbi:DUF4097 family beta strand repeat-containing protein [Catenulispora yoronensis]|uniref:DUF4097 family beta strand repeat-containing protein n=1 Tax=Catenulispora yoronensis TaxID=450799 RepID=A0ABP5FUB0_9ACTN
MQTFQTAAAITAVVEIPAGAVRFVAGAGTQASVEVRPADAAKNRDVKLAEQIHVEFVDGVLRVGAEPAKHKLIGHNGSVDVTVTLPAGSKVRARTSAGAIRGVGRFGEVGAEAAQGPIRFDETAEARLSVLDGAITVGRLGGAAELSTRRGDITVDEAVAGTVTLTTQVGNVTVGAAAESSATLDAGTALGRVTNALKNTGSGAQLAIRATTAQGDISARTR